MAFSPRVLGLWLQVDSRRTWELSKLITRNVEIGRRAQAGAPTDSLLPKPEKEETEGAVTSARGIEGRGEATRAE